MEFRQGRGQPVQGAGFPLSAILLFLYPHLEPLKSHGRLPMVAVAGAYEDRYSGAAIPML